MCTTLLKAGEMCCGLGICDSVMVWGLVGFCGDWGQQLRELSVVPGFVGSVHAKHWCHHNHT